MSVPRVEYRNGGPDSNLILGTVVFKSIGAGRERQRFSCPPHQNQVGAV